MMDTDPVKEFRVAVASSAPPLPTSECQDMEMEEVVATPQIKTSRNSPSTSPEDRPPRLPAVPRHLKKIIAAPTVNFSNDNLPLIKEAILRLKQIKEKLYEDEFQKMSTNSIETATDRLANAKLDQTEPPTAPLYPRDCLREIEKLSALDRRYMEVLLNSAVVKECKWPTFLDFTKQWESDTPEYQFQIVFSFGFGLEAVKKTVKNGCKRINIPDGVCGIIADCLGDSYFEIKLTVYFDKRKDDWNEQDGEAWIFHRGANGKLEDVVNFDKTERIYYVEDWPLKGLVVDAEEGAKLENIERKLVAWQCCQIIWFALGPNLDPKYCHCLAVRNAVKKLIFVLKGWFTGLLLGESFEPDGITFETD